MHVRGLFRDEDGTFKSLEKEHGVKGYAIIDQTLSLRGKPKLAMKKSVAKRFYELADEIDSLNEPDNVKRTAKAMLKDFIEHEINRVNRFIIGDRPLLIATLVYYSRVINGLPAKKPPKVDKRVKRFLFQSNKYAMRVKKGIINRRSVYIALMSNVSDVAEWVSNEIYSVSSVLGRYIKNRGDVSTKTIVSAVIYALSLEWGWNQERISKLFTTMGILKYNARMFFKNNPEVVANIISSMSEEDKKFLKDKLEEIIEKVSAPVSL